MLKPPDAGPLGKQLLEVLVAVRNGKAVLPPFAFRLERNIFPVVKSIPFKARGKSNIFQSSKWNFTGSSGTKWENNCRLKKASLSLAGVGGVAFDPRRPSAPGLRLGVT